MADVSAASTNGASSSAAAAIVGRRLFDLVASRVHRNGGGGSSAASSLMLLPMALHMLSGDGAFDGYLQACNEASGATSAAVMCAVVNIFAEGTKQPRFEAASAEMLAEISKRLFFLVGEAGVVPAQGTLSPLISKWMLLPTGMKTIATTSPILFQLLVSHLVESDNGPLSQGRVLGVLDRSAAISLRPHSMGYLLTFGSTSTRAAAIGNTEHLWQAAVRSPNAIAQLRDAFVHHVQSLSRGFSLKSLRWVELHCAVAVAAALSATPSFPEDDTGTACGQHEWIASMLELVWLLCSRSMSQGSPMIAEGHGLSLTEGGAEERPQSRPTTASSAGRLGGRLGDAQSAAEFMELADAIISVVRSLTTSIDRHVLGPLQRLDGSASSLAPAHLLPAHALLIATEAMWKRLGELPLDRVAQIASAARNSIGLALMGLVRCGICLTLTLKQRVTGWLVRGAELMTSLENDVERLAATLTRTAEALLQWGVSHVPGGNDVSATWALAISKLMGSVLKTSAVGVSIAVCSRTASREPSVRRSGASTPLASLAPLRCVASHAFEWQVMLQSFISVLTNQFVEARNSDENHELLHEALSSVVESAYDLLWHFYGMSDAVASEILGADDPRVPVLSAEEFDEDGWIEAATVLLCSLLEAEGDDQRPGRNEVRWWWLSDTRLAGVVSMVHQMASFEGAGACTLHVDTLTSILLSLTGGATSTAEDEGLLDIVARLMGDFIVFQRLNLVVHHQHGLNSIVDLVIPWLDPSGDVTSPAAVRNASVALRIVRATLDLLDFDAGNPPSSSLAADTLLLSDDLLQNVFVHCYGYAVKLSDVSFIDHADAKVPKLMVEAVTIVASLLREAPGGATLSTKRSAPASVSLLDMFPEIASHVEELVSESLRDPLTGTSRSRQILHESVLAHLVPVLPRRFLSAAQLQQAASRLLRLRWISTEATQAFASILTQLNVLERSKPVADVHIVSELLSDAENITCLDGLFRQAASSSNNTALSTSVMLEAAEVIVSVTSVRDDGAWLTALKQDKVPAPYHVLCGILACVGQSVTLVGNAAVVQFVAQCVAVLVNWPSSLSQSLQLAHAFGPVMCRVIPRRDIMSFTQVMKATLNHQRTAGAWVTAIGGGEMIFSDLWDHEASSSPIQQLVSACFAKEPTSEIEIALTALFAVLTVYPCPPIEDGVSEAGLTVDAGDDVVAAVTCMASWVSTLTSPCNAALTSHSQERISGIVRDMQVHPDSFVDQLRRNRTDIGDDALTMEQPWVKGVFTAVHHHMACLRSTLLAIAAASTDTYISMALLDAW